MASHVLIVDADDRSREHLCSVLKTCGAPIDCVPSIDDAFRWLNNNSPCAVVFACNAQGCDPARPLVDRLRLKAETYDTPVVLLSLQQVGAFDDRTTVLQLPLPERALVAIVGAAAARCGVVP